MGWSSGGTVPCSTSRGAAQGLGIAAPAALYVVALRESSAEVVVGPQEALQVAGLAVSNVVCHRQADEGDDVLVQYGPAVKRCRPRYPPGRRGFACASRNRRWAWRPDRCGCLQRSGRALVGDYRPNLGSDAEGP